MVPVIDTEGDIMGVVTEGNMSSMIISGRAQPDSTVADAGVIYKKFRKLSMNDKLSDLASALDIEPYGESNIRLFMHFWVDEFSLTTKLGCTTQRLSIGYN